jgi:hypothetical protein
MTFDEPRFAGCRQGGNVRFPYFRSRKAAVAKWSATVPVPTQSARGCVPFEILSMRNGYRFAKYEGESIVTIVEKRLKTVGFCDSALGARALRSRSIHRDA